MVLQARALTHTKNTRKNAPAACNIEAILYESGARLIVFSKKTLAFELLHL